MAACEAALDLASDYEDVLLDYDEACDEVVELQAELRAEKIEVQKLQVRLKAAYSGSAQSASSTSRSPPSLPAVGFVVEEQKAAELRRLFLWLAEHADLESSHELDVGFEVPIGGRTVHLQRVVQWRLPGAPGGQLLVTAPIAHKEPLGHLLATTRARGEVSADAILHFLAGWDLIAGELTTAAHVRPEPSVLLSERTSTQGILVASWPTREALQVFHTICPHAPRLGERVQVNYEGTWYTGQLQAVDGNGLASVRCDADEPGVLTVTPLSHVRRLGSQEAAFAGDGIAVVPTTAEEALCSSPLSAAATRVASPSSPTPEASEASVSEASSTLSSAISPADQLPEVWKEVQATTGCTQWARSHRRTRSSAL
eukprot:TRINITY_DN4915_c0_g1_i2.p1 TRINITY_DN4915_c0_g1~~TRINITY_DN4915_c0_g1_i2.p1  ORF type:complete len:371 (-),score=67.25 TRINITY_DN4915_c0_g1_i2:51-1163(-)